MKIQRLFTLSVIVLFAATGCRNRDGFTAEESRLIHSGCSEEIMRLCTVEDREDSLLLRKVSRPLPESAFFSEEHGLLVGCMLATVRRFDKQGEPFEVFVNPEIIRYSAEQQSGEEGCLSLPDVSGCVSRAKQVTLRYLDGRTFEKREEVIDGFTAVIVQHEIDHLDGRLFTDLLLPDENNRNTVPEAQNVDK